MSDGWQALAFGVCGATTVVVQVAFFLVAFTLGIDKVTDLAGTANFVVLAIMTILAEPGNITTRQLVTTSLVCASRTQLGAYLLVRPRRLRPLQLQRWLGLGLRHGGLHTRAASATGDGEPRLQRAVILRHNVLRLHMRRVRERVMLEDAVQNGLVGRLLVIRRVRALQLNLRCPANVAAGARLDAGQHGGVTELARVET